MQAVSSIDDHTAAAIRQAIGEASAGRFAAACVIGERALDEGGDTVALNALLGMLRCRTGEFEAALRHLRPAHKARPEDVSIASNLLMALVQVGENEEAFALASPELAKADRSLTVARYRQPQPAAAQAAIAALAEYVGPPFDVAEIHLMRSHLGPRPRHEQIDRWALGGTRRAATTTPARPTRR